MTAPHLCVILGTRPEAVKLASLIRAMRARSPEQVKLTVISTGQHTELLHDALSDLSFKIDEVMPPIPRRRDLAMLLEMVIRNVGKVFRSNLPDLAVVLGDTTSALGGALAASNLRVPVCHLEAGLRSGSPDEPFPEETNRRLLSRLASYHFPTSTAASNNLMHEGVEPTRIFPIKNPVCDTLAWALASNASITLPPRPMVLVTIHRREHREQKIAVLREVVLSKALPDNLVFTLVWHPSLEQERKAVNELGRLANFSIIPHEPYFDFVTRIAASSLIITDSGGVSEEATELHKPLVIFRGMTERKYLIAGEARSMITLDGDEILHAIKVALEAGPALLSPHLSSSGAGEDICRIILDNIIPHLAPRAES